VIARSVEVGRNPPTRRGVVAAFTKGVTMNLPRVENLTKQAAFLANQS
jgi:hypothetical protein